VKSTVDVKGLQGKYFFIDEPKDLTSTQDRRRKRMDRETDTVIDPAIDKILYRTEK
jgi:hypothetical protein